MSQLVLVSDTLITTPASGNLEYNGQFFGTDSNNARAQMQRIVQGTTVSNPTSPASASIDFTGIPAWVKKITVMFAGVSLSASANILVQLGDSGGIEITGYLGGCTLQAVGSTEAANSTAGYIVAVANAARVMHGNLIISAMGSNLWTASGAFGFSNAAASGACGGSKTLSDTLTQLRITTTSTDTFDLGSVNIMYEG